MARKRKGEGQTALVTGASGGIGLDLAECFAKDGYGLILTARSEAALSEAAAPVDVVLLDFQLPDVRNLSLLSAVRRRWPATRVVLMSADLTPEIVREALSLGACCVIAKPIDMLEVPALVHGGGVSPRRIS